MTALQLITDDIIPLKTSDTARQAISWMEEMKITHLPIVNNEMLLGLISEQDIIELNNLDEVIGNHKLSLNDARVNENQHIYEIIKLVGQSGLTLIPVVDDKGRYLGSITLPRIMQFLSSTLSVENPGGIIVLEMNESNYNLTEIVNIVESNNAKILSTFLVNHYESSLLELVIKINKIDIGAILQTFNRYKYSVKATFGGNEHEEDLKERFDSLMNYLNM